MAFLDKFAKLNLCTTLFKHKQAHSTYTTTKCYMSIFNQITTYAQIKISFGRIFGKCEQNQRKSAKFSQAYGKVLSVICNRNKSSNRSSGGSSNINRSNKNVYKVQALQQ